MIPKRFPNLFAAVVAAILLVGASLEAADLSRARVRDNIAYFLEPSPAQLKRYDMAAQAWLTPLPAPAGATCFYIDTNAIYFGTDQFIVRTGLGGGTGTNLATASAIMEDIAVAGAVVVGVQGPLNPYANRHLISVEKTTGIIRDLRPFSGASGRLTISSNASVVWTHGGDYVVRVIVDGAGMFGALTSRYLGNWKDARSPFLAKEGARLFLDDSTFCSPDDLTEIGQVSRDYRKLTANGAGFLATTGSNIVSVSRLGHETGRVRLSFSPGLVLAHGTNAFAFSDGLDPLAVVPLASMGGADPDGPVDYSGANLAVDSIASDGHGNVFFIDRVLPAVFGWSSSSGAWTPEIRLSSLPSVVAIDRSANRLLIGFTSGAIQTVDLSAPGSVPVSFGQVQGAITDLVAADGPVVAAIRTPNQRLVVFSSAGLVVTNFPASTAEKSFAWDASSRLLWRGMGNNGFEALPISAEGTVPGSSILRAGTWVSAEPAPSVLSPDRNRLLGLEGIVLNLTNLSNQTAGSLGIVQSSATWTTQGLHTVRFLGGFSQLQRWTDAFEPAAMSIFEGTPVALFPNGTNLLAVTRIGYELQFSSWTPGLALLGASPISPLPTNITFSGALTNRAASSSVVGSMGVEPALPGWEPRFKVVSVSPGESIHAVGSNLVYHGSQFLAASTNPIQVTVVATNQRGRSITRTISVPVIIPPAQRPVVTFERLTPSADAVPSRAVQFRITCQPAGETTFAVRFAVTGNATFGEDVYGGNLDGPFYQAPPFVASAYVSQGQTQAIFTVYPNFGLGRDVAKHVTLALLEDIGYQAASTNLETVFLWRSGYDAYIARRLGPETLTNATSAPEGDFDHDGRSNYAEYLFAVSPGASGIAPRPVVSTNGQLLLALDFRRSLPVEGQFDVLISTNLTNWWPAIVSEDSTMTSDGNSETVTWTLPVAGRSNLFARVRGAAYGHLRLPDFRIPGADIGFVGLPQVAVQLGSDAYESGTLPDERPRFVSSFDKSFWVSRREISQAEFVSLMTNNPSVTVGTNLPVENVTWTEAAEFCRRLTEREAAAGRLPEGYVFRLPTEAEWEYSARGGGYWPWGSIDRTNLTVSAWFAPNSFYVTHPVGRLAPNAYGLQDMLGNVAEWCADWYGPYPTGTVIDRVGPLFGTQRVIRGGNVLDSETGIRAAARSSAPPEFRSRLVGFRVVLGRPVQ